MQFETVLALAKALEARDLHTAGHGQRMTELAEKIAVKLGIAPTGLETIRWVALLHDIGKIGITDEILRKEGWGPWESRSLLNKHPLVGAEIVMNVSNLANVANLILFTSRTLTKKRVSAQPGRREDFFPGARIISVVDTYSAMTDGRFYRPPGTHEEAVESMQTLFGKELRSDCLSTHL